MGNQVSTSTHRPPKASMFDGREKTLSVQVVSDMHLEFYKLSSTPDPDSNEQEPEQLFSKLLQPSADYLALLGDIGLPCKEEQHQEVQPMAYEALLVWCSSRWKEVWLIEGNHEYYQSTDILTRQVIEEKCRRAGENVFFLHKRSLIRHGVRICGTCLWSRLPEEEPLRKYIQERLSDYSQIRLGQSLSSCRPLLPSDTHSWFIDQIRWLKREIQQVSSPKSWPMDGNSSSRILISHSHSF